MTRPVISDEDQTNRRASADQEDFEKALRAFLVTIANVREAHFREHYRFASPGSVSVDPGGKKYIRVVVTEGGRQSVFCFVDAKTGDILKADGWKRPAKHARGSIYVNQGRDAITPWGTHYIQPRGR